MSKKLPTVTEILKSMDYYKGLEFVDPMALEYGSNIHAMIDLHLSNNLDESSLDANQTKILNAFKEWALMVDLMVLSHEKRLTGGLYTGKPDLICIAKGSRWLIDFKSGMSKQRAYELQTQAYSDLWDEGQGKNDKIQKRGILVLLTNGVKLISCDNKADKFIWKSILNVYYDKLNNGLIRLNEEE